MKKFYISKFIHKINSSDNSVFLYDTRNFSLLKLNKKELSIYNYILKNGITSKGNEPFLNEFFKNNILTSMEDDRIMQKKDLNNIWNDKNPIFKINYARIKLTNKCNLNCSYCFVDKDQNSMSKSDIKFIIDQIVNYNKNDMVHIQYFGGEPMLKMNLILYSHEYLSYLKNKGKIKGFREELVTNGFYLNEDNIRFLESAQIDIAISVDGIKELNDMKRVTLNGKGTFDTIKEKINLYKLMTGKAPILVTLQSHNIDNFAENTKKLIKQLGVTSIGINMPQPCKKGWEISGKNMFDSIIGIYEYCVENNIDFFHGGNNIPYAIKYKKANFGSCSNCIPDEQGYRCGIFIDYNLDISTCIVDKTHNSSFSLYDLENKGLDKFKTWFLSNNYERKCYSCIAYNICTGMCSMEREYSKINKDRCYFYKKMVLWMIKKFVGSGR